MGKMAIKLKRLFDKAALEKVVSLQAIATAKAKAKENIKTMPAVRELIENGGDPLHAIYVNTLNLISVFCDEVTTLPPLHQVHDFISKWHDIYGPSYPPMSPVTNSFFSSWTLFDAAFGDDKETVGSCFLAVADRLKLEPVQVEVTRNLNKSRMGIYEVLTASGRFVLLRELVTGKEFNTLISSGHEGEPGDLLLVRIVPPLSDSVDYSVALTTPYQLIEGGAADWLRYFERSGISPNTVGSDTRLHRHMKYGNGRTYWSEYIFYGYANHNAGVILTAGFPDQTHTQPCHDTYDESRNTSSRYSASSLLGQPMSR